MSLVAGEFGKILRVNAGLDLSAQTGLTLVITRPDGSSVTRNAPNVAMGTMTVQTDAGTFTANQYVTYTLVDGDVPAAGRYKLKLTADFGATKRLKTVYATVEVEA